MFIHPNSGAFIMASTSKIFPLLSCWLFLHSTAHADIPSKESFDFLNHYQNASLVESGLGLLESTASLPFSTLVSLGFFYSICETPVLVSRLSQKFRLREADSKTLQTINKDFCMHLASVITTTEITLAGYVSPWPTTQAWWQSLRLAGAGFAAFQQYQLSGSKLILPITVLTYLAVEASARAASEAGTSELLRARGLTDIDPESYAYGDNALLSLGTGMQAGAIVYEILINKGLNPGRAVFCLFTIGFIGGNYCCSDICTHA